MALGQTHTQTHMHTPTRESKQFQENAVQHQPDFKISQIKIWQYTIEIN